MFFQTTNNKGVRHTYTLVVLQSSVQNDNLLLLDVPSINVAIMFKNQLRSNVIIVYDLLFVTGALALQAIVRD